MTSLIKQRLLVIGGTGFVGKKFVKCAVSQNYEVVSLSRRGTPTDFNSTDSVQWVKGDAVDPETIENVVHQYGPFDACIHTVGLLFDSQSGIKHLNVYASGSRSQASEDATYDQITRQTSFNAISSICNQQTAKSATIQKRIPFIFISAAEAGWTFEAPVKWLQRYLIAKRAVESKLKESEAVLRPVIFRPSIVWSRAMPGSALLAAPFYVGSALRIPIVDRPVEVDSLVNAMLSALRSEEVEGVQRFPEIDSLSASTPK